MRMKNILFAFFLLLLYRLVLHANPIYDTAVSYWKFDEASGSSVVDSRGSNNGTISGATRVTGQVGKALSFDGVNDYVTVNNSSAGLSIRNNLSVSLWSANTDNFSQDSAGNYLVSKGVIGTTPWNDYTITFSSSYKYSFTVITNQGNYSATTSSAYADSAMHHVTGVYDYSASQIRIYVDGQLQGSSFAAGTITNNNNTFYIGDWNGSSGWHFHHGKLDEVAVWNRTLSAQEAMSLYTGIPIPECSSFFFMIFALGVISWLRNRKK